MERVVDQMLSRSSLQGIMNLNQIIQAAIINISDGDNHIIVSGIKFLQTDS